jgi:hypothetical protein
MRRWAIRIFVFLLLGAIVNVAVAWSSALWVDGISDYSSFEWGYAHEHDETWHVAQGDRFGCTIVLLAPLRHLPPAPPKGDATEAELRDYVVMVRRWESGEQAARDADAPIVDTRYWSHARVAPIPSDLRIDHHEDARGWPMRSLLSWETFVREPRNPRSATSTVHWAIDLKGPQGRLGFPRRLPLRPIWPGFAINTVFYATILWLLFVGPFALRRWRRMKRGLCPKCGYDLRGSAPSDSAMCPECGAVRFVSR